MLRTFATTLLTFALLAPSAFGSGGWWNMPSTTPQYIGTGFGAGYHAPLVLGPTLNRTVASPGVYRRNHIGPSHSLGMTCLGDCGASEVVGMPVETTMPLQLAPPMADPAMMLPAPPQPEQIPTPAEPPSPSHDRSLPNWGW